MPTLQHRDAQVLRTEKKIDIPKLPNGGSEPGGSHRNKESVMDELGNMILLSVMYCLQGVPMGLSGGAMPFLLQSKASYTSIGLFSIASYPYSFKLFWSPIVDSIYLPRLGRRKSWIIPIQLMSAAIMINYSDFASTSLRDANIVNLTILFFVLVLLAATQDIAVDGWALTLLSKDHVGYASTCQTIGMNIGYFASFTVFLALNDPEFCNKYLRAQPSGVGIVTLSSYLRFWGYAYAITTVMLFAKQEREPTNEKDIYKDKKRRQSYGEVLNAYKQLWRVLKLKPVQMFSVVLITYRLGVLVAESAGPLKLLEKGVSKEALAGLVLLEFPLELVSAVVAGRWASSPKPFTPWVFGYFVRLTMAALLTFLIFIFPADATHLSEHPVEFIILAVLGVTTSFSGTLMFTAQGCFCNKISDPEMGGAYLTLLNTIANMGIILPKVVLFWLMDVLTIRDCRAPTGERWDLYCPVKKLDAEGSNPCTDVGGSCLIKMDGFYSLSYAAVFGGLFLGMFLVKILPQIQAMPAKFWHVKRE